MRVATGPGSNRLTRSRRGRDLLRPGQHQVLHPRLRRPHRPPIRPRLPRSAFRHEHRPPRRRQAQQRIAGPDQPPARRQVHRHDIGPVIRQDVRHRGQPAQRAGIVDQDVQPAEALEQGRADSVDLCAFTQIQRQNASPRRPIARIASSVSSRPPWVRAVITTRAPRRASSIATAAPMPRLAPVTSAMAAVRQAGHQCIAASRLSCRSALSCWSGSGIG